MSTAFSNLKKNKKTPLMPNGGSWRGRAAPFRQDKAKGDDSHLDIADHDSRQPPQRQNNNKEAPGDKELLSAVMKRLANAERELKNSRILIQEKDKRIKTLEDRCALLKKSKGNDNDRVSELETLCQSLQDQVQEMETFLEDYGMIWVGKGTSDKDSTSDAKDTDSSVGESNESLFAPNTLWHKETSVAEDFKIDFDQIVKNIKELNVLAGEGEHVINHTTDGARLKVKESVPLTLFANGLAFFEGPFRPYSDHVTQQCVEDLLDGYFPGELQQRYPDGVPIQLVDNRGVHFRDERLERLFPGSGRTLLECKQQEIKEDSLGKNARDTSANLPGSCKETKNIPGRHKQSLDQFLKKLPASVVQKGRMVQVRSDIEDMLKDSSGKSEVHIIETETAKEMRSRKQPGSAKRLSATTLRVKSENGEKTFLLKMRADETIGELRRYIDSERPSNSQSYLIRTTFPNKVYDNDAMTLRDCGLVPNATLHLTGNQP